MGLPNMCCLSFNTVFVAMGWQSYSEQRKLSWYPAKVARGFDRLKLTPTSFLTARATKWQMSKSGEQAAGKPRNWEADRP